MRVSIVLPVFASVGLLACASENGPTEPAASGTMGSTALPVAAAVDLWRERGPHPFPFLIGVSFGALVNPAGQSVVYAFGGCDVVESSFGQCTEGQISIYNVATDTWTGDRSFLVSVHSSNGVGAIGGKLYSSGGYTAHDAIDGLTSRAWAYDPAKTVPPGSEAGRATELAAMPKRTAEGVTGVIGNKLFVLPGLHDSGFEQVPIRRLYRYDPATNKWGARRSAPHFHRLAAAGVISGKFYVAGGLNSTALDVYDPATDTWTTRAPIPKAGRAIGTALDGKLYVVVGLDGYVYTPGTNSWSAIAGPTWGHEGLVRVLINGKPKLVAVGGSRGSSSTPNNTEIYTP